MELFLDTGNIEDIKELWPVMPADGVTTNPSIIAKEKKKFTMLISEISEIIGTDAIMHAQVISSKCADIIEEAKFISSLRENLFVKVPVTPDGLQAIRMLAKQGVKTTATAIFTAHQGFMAAKAGASYVAPYVNRLDNISADGETTVINLTQIIDQYGLQSKVLAASFKNAQQVLELMKAGVHSVTVPADVARAMISHPLTDWSVDKFNFDWVNAFGEGVKTNS